MTNIILKYVVKNEQVLREFLLENNISRKTLIRIKFDNDGSIKVNSKEENVRYILKKGDIVEITLPSENYSDFVRFIDKPIEIVYEDAYFLIVNKEINLPSIPSRNAEDESLLERVNYYFREKNINSIPHIVTRLDKNTSGLVLIAKHRHIHALFSNMEIDKYYTALINGKIKDYGIVEAPIRRVSSSIIEREVGEGGEYAKTEYWLERHVFNNNISIVKLKLYTGKTHQIRVHMKYLGYPLLGDELYGGDVSLISRQALHCSNLAFIHPISGEKVNVYTNLPNDMNNIIKHNE
ncbi:RluA family pseudouridine synthase [Gemella haemolysans]|uniref:RluA family pseudouridine synthase n=1 Tax=Gemella haemolysans TaxID=1379 RepID=UPI0019583E70|nr:RluA family pseudouridine synthase [Gemella haemolysans]VTX65445.1 Ribosomal large subunit pseudouridine synthase D [Gemella haemolysans]